MARKTIVTMEDDLDGGPADETVRFGIDGVEYEIDLSTKNAARLRKQVAPFIEHAHKAGRTSRRPARTAASRQRSHDIRAWAMEQGIELSERGRIPARIVAEYDAATRGSSRKLGQLRPGSGGGRGMAAPLPALELSDGQFQNIRAAARGVIGGDVVVADQQREAEQAAGLDVARVGARRAEQ
jgi:Lsr2